MSTEQVEIIPYSNAYQTVFKTMNLEWLDAYHLTESHDLMVLEDPQGTILDRGGVIYLAKSNNEIVGSAGLMKENDEVYELAKMFVSKKYRGMGISKMLLEKCIAKAKELKAKKDHPVFKSSITNCIRSL